MGWGCSSRDCDKGHSVIQKSIVKLAVLVLAVVLVQGCAYTTRNALPPHIKTIAVPMFNNRTFIDDYTRKLEVEVTEAVRNAVIQTGELKLAGREDADLILEGDVIKLERDVLRSDRYGSPNEIKIAIRTRISVYDVKEAKHMFKNALVTNSERSEESGVYNLRRGESEDMARQQAVTDVGKTILRRVLDRWPDPNEKKDKDAK